MQNNDHFPPQHESFSPEEQEAILSMAARMQSDSYRNASLADLEQTAMISGIDPRFVREAASRLSNRPGVGIPPVVERVSTSLDKWQATHAVIAILLFLPMQIGLTLSVLRDYGGYRLLLPAVILASVLGLVMPSGKQWRLPAAALSFAGAFVAYLIFNFRGYGYEVGTRSIAFLIMWVLIQGSASYAGHWVKGRLAYEGALSRRRI